MRRLTPLLLVAVLLGGCYRAVPEPSISGRDKELLALAPFGEIDLDFMPYRIKDPTGEKPGTVIVDTGSRHLYLVLEGGEAIRYGVSVGDEAFKWSGQALVGRKAEWPRWTPPAEMIARWPHLAPRAGGMEGGPDNPLGARALYLYQDGRDTLYRIHGTNEPENIGRAVSSGCIRMRNIDAIDLFNRVPVGARVVVR